MGINLTDRFWSKVDKDAPGGCWLWVASLGGKGYGYFRLDGRMRRAHRLSYEDAFRPIPDGMQVDHTCLDRACVNPAHLRLATPAENQHNRSGAQRNSKSGIRGVSWFKRYRKWRAVATVDRQSVFLGYYDTVEEAEAAVTEWRREHMPYSIRDHQEVMA